MTKLLAIIHIVTQLFPALIQLVKAVEQALPESGQGAKKLEMVRVALETAFGSVQGVTVAFAEVWPSLEKVIASVVATYNAIGTFKK